jgi:hypothetical protein
VIRDQAQTCISLIKGYWPSPPMFEEELVVWSARLLECEHTMLAMTIIEELAATQDFRPNAAKFAAIYKARAPRAPAHRPVADAPELEEMTEHLSTAEWRKRVLEQLAGSTGPMTEGLRKAVKGAR